MKNHETFEKLSFAFYDEDGNYLTQGSVNKSANFWKIKERRENLTSYLLADILINIVLPPYECRFVINGVLHRCFIKEDDLIFYKNLEDVSPRRYNTNIEKFILNELSN